MLQVDICEVEVYALHEHICSYEHFRVGVVEHGAVIAHALHGRFVLYFYVVGEMVDKTKLTEFRNVGHIYN